MLSLQAFRRGPPLAARERKSLLENSEAKI